MHSGAYTDHGTWRTPGPQPTPLLATPFESGAAGGVIPAATFGPDASAAGPEPVSDAAAPVPSAPADASPAAAPAVDPVRLRPPPVVPDASKPFCPFGVTVGICVTTSRSATSPIASGAYRRATRARYLRTAASISAGGAPF